MANHKSAKKRVRQEVRRRARNRHVRTGLKNAIKSVRTAIAGEDDATSALRSAERTIRKAASKGVLSKKQASRKVARLAIAVNASR